MAEGESESNALTRIRNQVEAIRDEVLDHPEVPEQVKIDTGMRIAKVLGELHVLDFFAKQNLESARKGNR